jgi:hypothetical protein
MWRSTCCTRAEPEPGPAKFFAEWGIDTRYTPAAAACSRLQIGGAAQGLPAAAQDQQGRRRAGQDHRLDPPHRLKNRGVEMLNGVQYQRIDDAGLHIRVGDKDITAAGGHHRRLRRPGAAARAAGGLQAAGCAVHLIGGADEAAELDAKRAIKQGTTLALAFDPAAAAAAVWRGRRLPHWRCSPPPRAWRNGIAMVAAARTWARWATSCTARRCSARRWRTRPTPARRRCS